MNDINEGKFTEAFEYLFGDFHPTQNDIKSTERIEIVQLKIDDFMDLIDNSVQAFETEALNIEQIYIGNVDTFLNKYKNHFFRTKKSMKIIKKRIKYVKNIKRILKHSAKKLMKAFKEKKKQEKNKKK